jgi:hypothetical protein
MAGQDRLKMRHITITITNEKTKQKKKATGLACACMRDAKCGFTTHNYFMLVNYELSSNSNIKYQTSNINIKTTT